MNFLVIFIAVVVVLGAIFISLTLRAMAREKEEARRAAKRVANEDDTSSEADKETWSHDDRPLWYKSHDDSGYRTALRRISRGEEQPPLRSQKTTDQAYRAALRQFMQERAEEDKKKEQEKQDPK